LVLYSLWPPSRASTPSTSAAFRFILCLASMSLLWLAWTWGD
jgi:hypothetical protein